MYARAPGRASTVLGFLLAMAPFGSASAMDNGQPGLNPNDSLKRLSLEALGNVEVSTASKSPERARRVPAAISVITQEDIRRSGVTSIPEALRLAPGVNVGRIDSAHWSVGIRGLGDQFSKSVLVLIDGRSVYTPLFAGVMWPIQDVDLDDVDRIEVIRGPGGTIWGANAVDGVINIITKRASDTPGARIAIGGGNVDQVVASARYGASHGSTFDYRIYGKGFKRGPQFHTDGTDFDRWQHGQFGFRTDWSADRDTVTVQGDIYKAKDGQSVSLASFFPPSQIIHFEPLDVSGGNLLAHWRRAFGSGGSSVQLQAYYDRTRFLGPQLGESRHTFDVDFVHHLVGMRRQDLTWGLGVRKSPSHIVQTVSTLNVVPNDQTDSIYSASFQDEVTAVENKLFLTAGAKLEHNNYTGAEVQPSVRLLWTPTASYSLWTAATRAVRTPSRLESGLQLTGFLMPSPLTFLRITGNQQFESERRIAYEGGARALITPTFYLDVAAFHNRLDDLESLGAPKLTVETSPSPAHLLLTFPYANGVTGTADGVEIAPTWNVTPTWDLKTQYSYLVLDLENQPGHADVSAVETYEGSSPRHQVSIQSLINLPARAQLDVTYRAVSALPARKVDAYWTVDLRVGQQISNTVEWSLAGQNLAQPRHVEFGHDPGPPVAVRRSLYASVTWRR